MALGAADAAAGAPGASSAATAAAAAGRLFSGERPGALGGGRAALLVVEHVPQLRARVAGGRDWPALAEQLKRDWLGEAAARLARERAERMVRAFEFMCDMQEGGGRGGPPGGDGGGGGGKGGSGGGGSDSGGGDDAARLSDVAGAPGAAITAASSSKLAARAEASDGDAVRVECWRRVRPGVHERWCDFSLALDGGRPAEAVAVKGEAGGEARGVRHRLAPLDADTDAAAARPLPCEGKIVARFRGRRAAALLQLPSVAVRSLAADAPAGLWVTVGLLAADGVALQLRLRRADRPVERDAATGAWCAYHVAGGAVTLLADGGGGNDAAAA